MKKIILVLFFLGSIKTFGQKDTTKWLRAFPITNYIVDVSDSIKIVQVLLPKDVAFTNNQIGLLRGMYRENNSDTMIIGTVRCNLIKGSYYYFGLNYKQGGKLPREGDLLFTLVHKSLVYSGNIVKLASHYIGLKNLYENPFYDRYTIFSQWTKRNEETLIDSIVSDIHFTGNYFLKNNPDMNVKIKRGKSEGKAVFNTMIICDKQDVIDFLEYMIARPGLYAGHEWKVSEIFATWLLEGSPTVVKK